MGSQPSRYQNSDTDPCSARNPLIRAAKSGNQVAIVDLLRYGTDVLATCAAHGQNALHYAAQYGQTEAASLLILSRIPVDCANNKGYTPLMLAASNGHLEVIKLLYSYKCDVQKMGVDGTALMRACNMGHLEIVRVLVEQGSNINDKDRRNGYTPLMWAVQKGHVEIVQFLVENGGDLNTTSNFGLNALMLAAKNGYLDVVVYLLEQNLDIDVSDRFGYTPVMYAATDGKVDVARALCDHGCNIQATNNLGQNALMIASMQGHIKIVELLLSKMAAINKKCNAGSTALHYSSSRGHKDVIKALLKAGADTTIENKKGKTAEMAAYSPAIAALLTDESDLRQEMDNVFRRTIRAHYIELLNEIRHGVEDICIYLWSKGVITDRKREEILEGRDTSRQKAGALLDLIPNLGFKACRALYAACVEYSFPGAAKVLKEAMPSVDECPELPASWPMEEEDVTEMPVVKTIDDMDTEEIDVYRISLSPGQEEVYYQMKNMPRGRVLIINNMKFEHMDFRDGSFRDQRNLRRLFEGLGFTVDIQENNTANEMLELIKDEAKRQVHKSKDCFILFVMSHGHEGVVLGTDGYLEGERPRNYVEIRCIRDMFCESVPLMGKPKLLFFQACRGSSGEYVQPGSRADRVNLRSARNTIRKLGPHVAADATNLNSQARGYSEADIMIALATTAGNVARRHEQMGTWFVQAIVYVFSRFAYKYDIHTLMTYVNNLVTRADAGEGQRQQVAERIDTFSRRFFFFPGLPRRN